MTQQPLDLAPRRRRPTLRAQRRLELAVLEANMRTVHYRLLSLSLLAELAMLKRRVGRLGEPGRRVSAAMMPRKVVG